MTVVYVEQQRLQSTWEDDFWEAHFPDDSCAAVDKVGVVLPDLGEIPREELQGHKESCQQTCKEMK